MNQLNAPVTKIRREESDKLRNVVCEELPSMAPSSASTPPSGVFAEVDWVQFHSEDKRAAAAIVAVMLTVFSLGLIGYIVIALVCAKDKMRFILRCVVYVGVFVHKTENKGDERRLPAR